MRSSRLGSGSAVLLSLGSPVDLASTGVRQQRGPYALKLGPGGLFNLVEDPQGDLGLALGRRQVRFQSTDLGGDGAQIPGESGEGILASQRAELDEVARLGTRSSIFFDFPRNSFSAGADRACMTQYRDWDPHGHRLGAREDDDDYDLDELGHYEQVRCGLRRPAPGKVTLTQHLRYTPPPAGAAVQMKPRSPAAEATAAAWRAKDRASWGFLAGRYEDPLPTADPDAAVQAKSSGMTADPDEVHAAAAQGGQGSGEPLPHFEKIQKSLCAHDLSGVRANIGGKATDAASAIGASAYATGNKVAFEKAPDVHTAAHEAAHVVQQRAGVQLLGGVGEAGDKYERQADAVGDAVVRGESAAELLGGAKVPSRASTSAVQRQVDYLGSSESLARDGASSADDDQLRAGMLGTRQDMATLDPSDPMYGDRQQNLAVMQREAASRGVGEAPPSVSAEEVVFIAGVVLAPDATYMRFVLEQMGRPEFGPGDLLIGELDRDIAAHRARLAASDQLGADQRAHDGGVAPPVPAGVPLAPTGPGESYATIEADITLRERIRSVLVTQLATIARDNAAFKTDFETEALRVAYALLDDSEARVTSEMQRYGMSADRQLGLSGATADNARHETKEMQQAATQLLASARVLEAATTQAGAARVPSSLVGEQQLDGDAADAELKRVEYNHAQLRVTLEAEFPALARYQSTEALEEVTRKQFGTKQMAWDLDENLINIANTRKALANKKLSVLRLPQVVQLVREAKLVVPGSMRDRVVRDAVADAAPSMLAAIAISVVSIGLGILAAVGTGGTLAPAAASVVLDTYLTYKSIQDYRVASAATGTDPDRARALSQGEPSMFWLAFEIVSNGIVGAAATRAFRAIASARRAALAARDAQAVLDQLREVRRLARAARLSEDAEKKLVTQVLREHPHPKVAAEAKALVGAGSTKPGSIETLRIQGMAQRPGTYPWRKNPDGHVRSLGDAIGIARIHGVEIHDDIRFVVVKNEWLPPDALAQYLDLRRVQRGRRISWENLLTRFDDIAVKLSKEILSSDEAIVAVLSHEMHELNELRQLFVANGGWMSGEQLRRLIHPQVSGNLHDHAWDVADALVAKMRAAGKE